MKKQRISFYNICIYVVLVAFFVTSLNVTGSSAFAQEVATLPTPGVMVHLSPSFEPPVLTGIKVHPDNPFRFDFLFDQGDSQLSQEQIKEESTKLIKYFMASLTTPENDLWVNLSPYEKDRIIPNSFGLTEMGRDLLAQDYLLKQITASLIYPEGELGKKFWKRIYEEAQRKFGTTNIPINTFNKVWIIPEKAVVYENGESGTAYVVQSKLKVMLEEDYLSLKKHVAVEMDQPQDTNKIGSQIVREIVLPQLSKEINENKNFARLRQVYNSLILATWYKKKVKESILSNVYADKDKVQGINIDDPQEKEKIYQRYLKAFKKGVYNYIKEEQDPLTQEIVPRKYFSGGESFYQMSKVLQITQDSAMVSSALKKKLIVIGATLTLAAGSLLYISSNKTSEHFAPAGHETLLIIGQQKETIDEYVRKMGTPAGFMTYTSLKDLEGLITPTERGAGTQHAQDLVDHYPHTVLQIGLSLVGDLDDINSGKRGMNITLLANWIKQAKVPVFLRIGYEFDNPENNYYPKKYVEAYRRIASQLREVEHVDNVVFVWHSNSYGHGPFKDYYPGDKYVDWVGMSYFVKSNEVLGKEIFQFADEHGKPKMICEASPWKISTPESKSAWFKDFFSFVRQQDVKAVGYINSNWDALPLFQSHKYGDSRIEQDPNILKLWNEETKTRYLKASDKLYKEINYDPNKKSADQAMLFRRSAPRPEHEGQRENFIQKLVKRPNFFLGLSVGLYIVASMFYGPIAAFLYFNPFVLSAVLAIVQDFLGANPGKIESKYYVDQFETLPPGVTYPEASIIIPVYREPFEVLAKTVYQANKAVSFYNQRSRGNLANLVVLDDGLQTLDQPERDMRIRFYRQMGVSVLARPPNNAGGFKRTGFFKKASNLNYAFALDAKLRRLLRDNPWSTQSQLLQHIRTRNANPETRYDLLYTQGDNILLGDFILLVDNDSFTPEKSLLYSVHSLLRRPQAGYIQHVSRASNKDDNLLTKIYALSTSVFWRIVLRARSLYAPTAILGHNLVLRKTALVDVVNNSPEPGPFHEGRGADDLIPGINMRTGQHQFYGMLGNMPFERSFEEGIPNLYSDLAGQMRRYGATGTGSIINPFSLWFKQGIFRPEFSAVLKDKNITLGEKYDTFMYAHYGLHNFFMMLMIGVAVSLVFLDIPNALAIGFIRGLYFATISQLGVVIYFQLKSLQDHSWKGILRTVVFTPSLFFCLSFQNSIGVVYDLMFSRAKGYGSTAIRKPTDKFGSRLFSIISNNALQIVTGVLTLGIATLLLFKLFTWYTVFNAQMLFLYLVYFGMSLIVVPFIFSGKAKNHAEEDAEFVRQFERAQAPEPQDRAMTVEGKGGIDFTPANLDVQSQNNGVEIKLHFDAAMIERFKNAPGFVPVVHSINPLTDLTMFLGLPEKEISSITN